MKALVYQTAHKIEDFAIELIELHEPVLRERDVLIEVRAIGVNPGETFIRRTRSAQAGSYVLLGFEFAGVVVGVGTKVVAFGVGDRVFGTGDASRDGCWAERVAVDHRVVSRIPDQLSFIDAASLPIGSATAWEAIFRDRDEPPTGVEHALILGGAGGVGSMATQLLKARTNAFVISSGSRPESRVWCEEMGADLVVDHTGDVAAQLAAAGIPHVDVVFSTADTAKNLGWIAGLLRPFGHLSFVDGSAALDVSPLVSKSISLHTEMVFSRVIHASEPERQGKILETVAALVVDGRIKPITKKRLDGLTVETMKAAHELLETGRTIGKIVIAT